MDSFDLIVIGGGPGGYVAAIRAAQLGQKVACVEKEDIFGGTCLRVGCIPSKALLESSELLHEAKSNFKRHGIVVGEVSVDLAAMMRRKDTIVKTLGKGIDGLFKKHGITPLKGTARFVDGSTIEVDDQRYQAKNFLIATGSVPASLPGIELDGDRIGSSTEALKYPEVPGHLVVIGAGAIGLELGSVWGRLGAKVTVLEYLDRILPGADLEIAQAAQASFKRQGMTFHLGCKVTGARLQGEGCIVERAEGDPIECDRVLVSVGRRPNTEGLGLEAIGLETDRRGFISVDEHFKTGVPGVYAIGDVIGGAMLAHKAEEEGVACVEHMVTGYGHVDHNLIPAVVYTHPEVASVGRTEEQLKEDGIEIRKGTFPFAANGRARALGSFDGLAKVIADAETDRILGVHIVGPRAGDLIAESVVAMAFSASSEDIARICHAHPTLPEVVKEAALAVDGRPLHI
ncbi:MAG: dihydrolipoyl dehydrogenase [Candidatus Eremiobacteraeota bacterium]|nr:dihydrolipoyl dehydrogenase [Candidatus Eremiobacteraeota bacterium]